MNWSLFTLLCFLVISPIGLANERAQQLYQSCVECHGDNGYGDQSQEAPRIAGQHEWYIYSSLVAFKSKERTNTKMYPFIKDLSDKDFRDLAEYVANMK